MRKAWFQAFKICEGRTIQEFDALAQAYRPMLTKERKAEAVYGWLVFFVGKDEIRKSNRKTTEELIKSGAVLDN